MTVTRAILDGFRGRVDRRRIQASVLILLGASQLLLSFRYVGDGGSVLIIAAGGWLLLGLGEATVRGRVALESWIRNDPVGWALLGASLIVSVFAAAYAIGMFLPA